MKRTAFLFAALLGVSACGGNDDGPVVEMVVPQGATFAQVIDSLMAREIISSPTAFKIYARVKGADRGVKAGRYALTTGGSWSSTLERLTRGSVVTVPMTIPEGFRLAQMVPRIAEITGADESDVLERLESTDGLPEVPGPTLEGYLFPDTYRFARGVSVEAVVTTMIERYQSMWTPERRARLAELGMTETELVALASIIQAEARHVEEMPTISSVYHNRLRDGWLLQADPTVQYALGVQRERLLYAAIDSVADNPYNTYTQRGLPPGPIGSPGELAIEAALNPTAEDFMFFVARPDGSHVFTRTLGEHNRAKNASRRELDRLARDAAAGRSPQQ